MRQLFILQRAVRKHCVEKWACEQALNLKRRRAQRQTRALHADKGKGKAPGTGPRLRNCRGKQEERRWRQVRGGRQVRGRRRQVRGRRRQLRGRRQVRGKRQVRGRRQAGQREEAGQANNEALSFCCEDFTF